MAQIQHALKAPGLPNDLRPLVWYFDDESTLTESFIARHERGFRIRTFDDAADLLSTLLAAAMGPAKLPDLLLIDLYCFRGWDLSGGSARADACISDMIRAEKHSRGHVDSAWRPVGVEIVEAVREFYPPTVLPLIMHTQQGLILLCNELIQQLESLGVGWVLKNRFKPRDRPNGAGWHSPAQWP